MKSRLIFALVGAAIITVIWFQREEKQSEEFGAEVLAISIERFSQIDGYQDNKDHIDQAIARAHEQAFSFAYEYGSIGRRNRRGEDATFDEKKYTKWLFTNVRRELRKAMDDVPTRARRRQLEKFMKRVDELPK